MEEGASAGAPAPTPYSMEEGTSAGAHAPTPNNMEEHTSAGTPTPHHYPRQYSYCHVLRVPIQSQATSLFVDRYRMGQEENGARGLGKGLMAATTV